MNFNSTSNLQGFRSELEDNILSFWMRYMPDEENSGFYGRLDAKNHPHKTSGKGAVLNTRILWTYSAAYRLLKKPAYLAIAQRAYEYITRYFIDEDYGGVFWELNYKGEPVNTKKQAYAQGFALYGMSEYYRATGDERALDISKDLFFIIEKFRDRDKEGYIEAYARDWTALEDVRLSQKDPNYMKGMNSHLHILEPYTNLCRIWDLSWLHDAHTRLIRVFLDRMLDSNTYHFNSAFDEDWNVKSTEISYGHDIEAAWLLNEAAEVSGDERLIDEVKEVTLKISDAAAKGLQPDGSMIYERNGNHIKPERHWWVQAEAVVGYMYAYKNSGRNDYLQKATNLWTYIQDKVIDRENGEWFETVRDNGEPNRGGKANFWKCPYHNGRMCMEMIEHFNFT